MSAKSSIEWCTSTWNPLVGCTQVSAGCDHCYALTLHEKRHKAWLGGTFPSAPKQYHKPFSEVQLIPERLRDPLRWRDPRLVFVNSLSDLFHADVTTEFIARVFAVMAATPRHTFQVLTKRPQRMARVLNNPAFPDAIVAAADDLAGEWGWCHIWGNASDDFAWPLPNVWLGTSVENQEAAYRLDWLAKVPAAVRFVSAEPLLGPLNLDKWLGGWSREEDAEGPYRLPRGIDWVITGGESGPGHRPCDPQWVRDIRDQCIDACVAFFHKQWGGHVPKAGGRELDGLTWDEMPDRAQPAGDAPSRAGRDEMRMR